MTETALDEFVGEVRRYYLEPRWNKFGLDRNVHWVAAEQPVLFARAANEIQEQDRKEEAPRLWSGVIGTNMFIDCEMPEGWDYDR